MVIGGSCYAVYKLNATNTNTARAIAMFLWSPMILSSLLLLPVLGATNLWLNMTGTNMVTWVDYTGAFYGIVVRRRDAPYWCDSREQTSSIARSDRTREQRQPSNLQQQV